MQIMERGVEFQASFHAIEEALAWVSSMRNPDSPLSKRSDHVSRC